MEINYNLISNNYNSSTGMCSRCGNPTILECGLCPSCCLDKYNIRSTEDRVYLNSKLLIARQNNKNIYCGDILMGKKTYCTICQTAQQDTKITKIPDLHIKSTAQ